MSELDKTYIEITDSKLHVRFKHAVPRDPDAPDREGYSAISIFNLFLGEKLPYHVEALHAQNPTIIPILIEILTNHSETTKLSEKQIAVVQYCLTLLRVLVGTHLILVRKESQDNLSDN